MRIFHSFRLLVVLAVIFTAGLAWVFTDSYYLRNLRTVNNAGDPRWRVFDLNSRQASEGEIYNVAEVPVISKVKEVAPRKLRFWFSPPIDAGSWKIIDINTGEILGTGKNPEVQFPDMPYHGILQFIPVGIDLFKDIRMEIDFYPGENYKEKGLSWGDNYYAQASDIPFGLKTPYSIDEWTGYHKDDPELAVAKKILKGQIDRSATSLEQSEQIYRFIMNEISGASGTPSDEVQSASPLETYYLLKSGKGKGWCENKALVYYLFANAAGIKTRLIDAAGKFGPLKLAGHYFCESWMPEYAKWVYVDPQLQIANITGPNGIPLHTVELKKLLDLGALDGTTATVFQNGALSRTQGKTLYSKIAGNIPRSTVLAYKFGYPNNKDFNKVGNFLKYTPLLYASFTLPRLYLIKYFFIYGSAIFISLAIMAGLLLTIKKII